MKILEWLFAFLSCTFGVVVGLWLIDTFKPFGEDCEPVLNRATVLRESQPAFEAPIFDYYQQDDGTVADNVDVIVPSEVAPGPEYLNYSVDELRSLSVSDANAAVMLARKVSSTTEAEELYELAVALSGNPQPLVEWMFLREQGGIEHDNGVLNIDKAMQGYEIALVQKRLHNADSGNVPYYEKILHEAGADLEPAWRLAEERYERLTELRMAVVGRPWS